LSTVVTVCDIVKKKDEDNTNSSYYSHNDYDRYSKEKDYSPDLENDDGQEAVAAADSSNNPSTATKEQEEQSSLYNKRILLVDDEPDITLTYKSALEGAYDDTGGGGDDDGDGNSKKTRTKFEVHAYNDPLEALLNFKPNFYDLLLIDINLPNMNGFELCEKLLKMDINMRVCFVSAGEVNEKAIREIHPSINIGCFIKKPVSMEDLVKRIKQN
jgi:CheY-like chemotaxis protein